MPTARFVQRSTIAGVGNGAGGVALSSLRPETVSSTVPELGSQHKQDQSAVVTLGHPHASQYTYDAKNSDEEDRFADADEDDVEDGKIWEDVGNNRAQKKTSQCLRDRNPQIRAAEGIAALFRVGEAEKEEQKRREEERRKMEEREDRKARRIADIAAYRAQQAAVMPPAHGTPPIFTTMGPYYQQQQQQPLLKRHITQTTDSLASAQQKRPRLGFPKTFATGTNVPGAPLWQQSPPIATAPDVAVGPYNSADVSAQVAAEKQRIASLQEKIKLAQVRIDNSHKLIDSTHATKPKTAENPAIPPLPHVNPAIPPPPTANPAIPPPPTMPQSQIARAPLPVNIPVRTAPPAPHVHVHVAPMPEMYPAAIAMAMPQAPYPARLPPPPPPHCMYMNSPPAYHPMAYPAGIPNQPAYPVAAGPLHQAHPPPSSLPAKTFPGMRPKTT